MNLPVLVFAFLALGDVQTVPFTDRELSEVEGGAVNYNSSRSNRGSTIHRLTVEEVGIKGTVILEGHPTGYRHIARKSLNLRPCETGTPVGPRYGYERNQTFTASSCIANYPKFQDGVLAMVCYSRTA
jgi:hypothetical protein